MAKFNHMFTVAFEVVSDQEDGEDVTTDMFLQALTKRAQDLTRNNEWREAVGAPDDTYEIESPNTEQQ